MRTTSWRALAVAMAVVLACERGVEGLSNLCQMGISELSTKLTAQYDTFEHLNQNCLLQCSKSTHPFCDVNCKFGIDSFYQSCNGQNAILYEFTTTKETPQQRLETTFYHCYPQACSDQTDQAEILSSLEQVDCQGVAGCTLQGKVYVPEVAPGFSATCLNDLFAMSINEQEIPAMHNFRLANEDCIDRCYVSEAAHCTEDCNTGLNGYYQACVGLKAQVFEVIRTSTDPQYDHTTTTFECFPDSCENPHDMEAFRIARDESMCDTMEIPCKVAIGKSAYRPSSGSPKKDMAGSQAVGAVFGILLVGAIAAVMAFYNYRKPHREGLMTVSAGVAAAPAPASSAAAPASNPYATL